VNATDPGDIPAHRRRGYVEDLVQEALKKTHREWGQVARMDASAAYVRRATGEYGGLLAAAPVGQ
jgi:hypothetical protein